jgi:hypothetical protein
MAPGLQEDVFLSSSDEDKKLCHDGMLLPALGFRPHDYYMEGVYATLNGKDIKAIIPTEDKTFMFMLAVL